MIDAVTGVALLVLAGFAAVDVTGYARRRRTPTVYRIDAPDPAVYARHHEQE